MRDSPASGPAASSDGTSRHTTNPPVHLRRQRLHDLLTAGGPGPLTAVVGPAGYGKTSLVASWIREAYPDGPTAWLTLDDGDNHPVPFWRRVLDALRGWLPDPRRLDAVPLRRRLMDRRLMLALATELSELAQPVVLVLDRTELITNRILISDFPLFVRHAMPGLRLIAVGRRARILPRHLYRLTGELTEIGTGALALTPDETAELLDRYGVRLDDDETTSLYEETEGWVTGVCLHAIALRNEDLDLPRVSARRAVSEYLRNEVLHRQPAAAQGLLLRTCVLDEVVPELADRITGRYDARAVLDELVQENAFVQQVDDSRYRYRPLFRAALHDEVSMRYPGLLPRLHRTAAEWFAENDQVSDALRHLTRIGEWDKASALAIGRLGVAWLLTPPAAEPVRSLFQALPTDQAGASAALLRAVLALARADTGTAQVELDRARHAVGYALSRSPALHLDVATAAVMLCRLSGDVDGAVREMVGVDQALTLLSPTAGQQTYAFAQWNLGAVHAWTGRLDDARAALNRAAADLAHGYTVHGALGHLAIVEVGEGALRRAEWYANESIAVADRMQLPPRLRTGAAHATLGAVALIRNDLPGARELLALARTAADAQQDPATGTALSTLEAGIAHAEMDLPAARAAVDNALTGARRWHASQITLRRIELVATDIELSRQDPASARRRLEALPDGPERTVGLAYTWAAEGDMATSRRLLDQLPPNVTDLVRDRVAMLRAELAMADGDPDAAAHAVRQALEYARPEHRRRRFADAGPWLRELLQQRPDLVAPHPWLAEQYPLATDSPEAMGGEALTGRELEVLQTLTEGLSTEDMARELKLSVNTVKTHLKSIYRKLGTHRRSATALRARELRLVDYPKRVRGRRNR
jgi:LuxR family transcriptional regulator, maltose regulon positive regulatory protein